MNNKQKILLILSTVALILCLNQTVKAQSNDNNQTAIANEPFNAVEILPEYPGGIQNFAAFINKNLDQSKASQPEKKVIITFVVEKDGSLKEVRPVGHIFDKNAAKEAVRVVKLSPKWIPGKQNGKLVKVQYAVPVVFIKQ